VFRFVLITRQSPQWHSFKILRQSLYEVE
jgi:hypothetical protein